MKKLHVCFACDAGMGSSALGASILKRLLKNQNVKVSNSAISQLDSDIDIIITQEQLANTIKNKQIYKRIYTVDHYLNDEKIKKIVKEIRDMIKEKEVLSKESIVINCQTVDSDDAIRAVGSVLLKQHCIDEPYIEGMIKRDHDVTTYIGNDIAIPHGEYEVKQYVKETGLAVMTYPDGIDWHGQKVRVVIGIAAKGDDHMELLSNIALKLSDMETVDAIVNTQDIDYIYQVLTK